MERVIVMRAGFEPVQKPNALLCAGKWKLRQMLPLLHEQLRPNSDSIPSQHRFQKHAFALRQIDGIADRIHMWNFRVRTGKNQGVISQETAAKPARPGYRKRVRAGLGRDKSTHPGTRGEFRSSFYIFYQSD